MRNRSKTALPSQFEPALVNWLETPVAQPHPLEIYQITCLHFHSHVELGYCVSGCGTCVVEGEEQPFQAGDAQIIFPFQNHLSRSEGEKQSRWYWLNIDLMELLSAWGAPDLPRMERLLNHGMGLYGIIARKQYPLLAELIARVIMVQDEKRRLACLCALIEELAGESQDLPKLELKPSSGFARLIPALEAIHAGLKKGEVIRQEELARLCAMSSASLRREFGRVMGVSPRAYLKSCQMKKAQQLLLLTHMPITQIALTIGYEDVSGFNRQFSCAFGMPPREYRRMGGMTEKEENTVIHST